MIPDTLLTKLGIAFIQKGSEYQLDCPYCGKAKHLYLNSETGAFKCHHCDEAGGWAKLREEYGESGSGIREPKEKAYSFPSEAYVESCFHRLLGPTGTHAVEYLKSRKITTELIHRFKLGLDKKKQDGQELNVIAIPTYENGKPVNIKYRTIPPKEKQFLRWSNGKSALFNGDILKDLEDTDAVFVTEGEIDCISLTGLGYNAVGVTVGAGTIKPEWIKQLERFQKIYLVYDNDEKGKEGANKIARRLGAERCYYVQLSEKDVNEWVIKGGTNEEFSKIMAKAELFGIENIVTSEQAFIDYTKEYDRKVDATALVPPWPSVLNLTGPYEPGDLIVVSAKEKTGKTTWVLNKVHYWGRQGHPVLFYCLEMRPARLIKKLIQIAMRKTDEELDPKTMYEGYRKVADYPIYWGYNYKKCTANVVFETIRLGWKRYGLECVVFDNLHYLARDITHQTQEVGFISRSFKLLAEELEIPIILIAQPRKIERDGIMGIEDLKDSSSIGADADQVIILYRQKTKPQEGSQEAFKPETLVRVDASRFKAGGETLLYFDGSRSIFTEISGNK